MLKYGSVCSGVEAASVAWEELGFKPQWFSEIEKFPSEVLKHRFPNVPNLGDMTKLNERDEFNERTIDILVGGTPCQSFSVAGLRGGLEDERGNLALEFCRIALRKRPRWVVWENVPGVLSSNGGRDFASILGGLAECGYGFAYRVLDAQHFGVPQRRRRVFVVGYLGDWRPPAAVLFEQASLFGDTTPSRETWQEVAPTIDASIDAKFGSNQWVDSKQYVLEKPSTFIEGGFGGYNQSDQAGTTKASGGVLGGGSETFAIYENHPSDSRIKQVDTCPTVTSRWGTGGGNAPYIQKKMQVRKLTPLECERLQGFPDNWTKVRGDKTPNGPRYKAMGNSMAVPVMRFIGERIKQVEEKM